VSCGAYLRPDAPHPQTVVAAELAAPTSRLALAFPGRNVVGCARNPPMRVLSTPAISIVGQHLVDERGRFVENARNRAR